MKRSLTIYLLLATDVLDFPRMMDAILLHIREYYIVVEPAAET